MNAEPQKDPPLQPGEIYRRDPVTQQMVKVVPGVIVWSKDDRRFLTSIRVKADA